MQVAMEEPSGVEQPVHETFVKPSELLRWLEDQDSQSHVRWVKYPRI